MMESNFAEDRLDDLREAYADGKVEEEELDEALDAIVRDGPPFRVRYALKQWGFEWEDTEDGVARIMGYEVELDGRFFREK